MPPVFTKILGTRQSRDGLTIEFKGEDGLAYSLKLASNLIEQLAADLLASNLPSGAKMVAIETTVYPDEHRVDLSFLCADRTRISIPLKRDGLTNLKEELEEIFRKFPVMTWPMPRLN